MVQVDRAAAQGRGWQGGEGQGRQGDFWTYGRMLEMKKNATSVKRFWELLGQYEWFWKFKKAWLVIKHRSFLKCPYCKGKGGATEGYYEPEWTECHCCWDHYDELVDHGMGWFEGRLPLLAWIKAHITARLWWRNDPLHWIVLCKLGFHHWIYEECIKGEICTRCYESKKKINE